MQTRQPDALLLSGDVFDSINPSALAQKRFYNFLAASHAALPSLQMVITAGNHDAAARLEAPESLLDSLNMTVVGTVRRDDDGEIDVRRFLVPLRDAAGDVAGLVLAVPFLRPADVPFIPDAVDPYLDGVRELYRRVTEAALAMQANQISHTALIGMGHCHLHGGSESPDSERRLVVGGAEAVSVDMFDSRLAYVALGHLHRAQNFDKGRVRYSGSPIPLSFAEAGYRHQVLEVTLEGQELLAVDEIPVPASTKLMKIPPSGAQPIDELISQLQTLDLEQSQPLEQQPFLEVRVQEDGPDPTRRTRIEQALEGQKVRLASIKVERPVTAEGRNDAAEALHGTSLEDVQPLEVFMGAWREKYDSDPDPAVIEAFREILLQESHS